MVQLNTGAENKSRLNFFSGSAIAFILAITDPCLLRLELITETDKLFLLSLLQLG